MALIVLDSLLTDLTEGESELVSGLNIEYRRGSKWTNCTCQLYTGILRGRFNERVIFWWNKSFFSQKKLKSFMSQHSLLCTPCTSSNVISNFWLPGIIFVEFLELIVCVRDDFIIGAKSHFAEQFLWFGNKRWVNSPNN